MAKRKGSGGFSTGGKHVGMGGSGGGKMHSKKVRNAGKARNAERRKKG